MSEAKKPSATVYMVATKDGLLYSNCYTKQEAKSEVKQFDEDQPDDAPHKVWSYKRGKEVKR